MSVQDFTDFKVADKINTIYPPILVSVGLLGNILSLLVLLQQNNRKTSTGVMLIVLAVTDSLILVGIVLLGWLAHLFEVDFRNSSTVACKVHVFLTYLLLQLSAWVLVFVTVERVFSVLFPHKVRDVFTRRRVLVAMAIFIVFLIGLNSHLLHGYQIHFETLRCQVKDEHEKFMFKIWTWIDFAVAFAIPFIVLFFGNITVIVKLKASRAFQTRSATVSENSGHSNNRTHRRRPTPNFTATALILNVSFVIFVSPFGIFAIGQPYWFPPETFTPELFANLILIGTVTKMLMYINNGINFVLYVLSGSKFRKEFMTMICCVRKQRRFEANTISTSMANNSFSNISRISRISMSTTSQASDKF